MAMLEAATGKTARPAAHSLFYTISTLALMIAVIGQNSPVWNGLANGVLLGFVLTPCARGRLCALFELRLEISFAISLLALVPSGLPEISLTPYHPMPVRRLSACIISAG